MGLAENGRLQRFLAPLTEAGGSRVLGSTDFDVVLRDQHIHDALCEHFVRAVLDQLRLVNISRHLLEADRLAKNIRHDSCHVVEGKVFRSKNRAAALSRPCAVEQESSAHGADILRGDLWRLHIRVAGREEHALMLEALHVVEHVFNQGGTPESAVINPALLDRFIFGQRGCNRPCLLGKFRSASQHGDIDDPLHTLALDRIESRSGETQVVCRIVIVGERRRHHQEDAFGILQSLFLRGRIVQ